MTSQHQLLLNSGMHPDAIYENYAEMRNREWNMPNLRSVFVAGHYVPESRPKDVSEEQFKKCFVRYVGIQKAWNPR